MPKPSRSLGTAPSGAAFEKLVNTAHQFWSRAGGAASEAAAEKVIVVDLKCFDLRAAIRLLSCAAALRRVVPARLVAYVGIDPRWAELVWAGHDPAALARLGAAYGVEAEVDCNLLLDPQAAPVSVGGRPLVMDRQAPGADEELLSKVIDATAARLLFVPRVTEAIRSSPEFLRIAARARRLAGVNTAMLASWDVVAYLTAHVDYADWGLLTEQALRAAVPVVHVQSTGGVKAYTVFPEDRTDNAPMRTHVTRSLTTEMREHIWPRRELLRGPAELTTWRSKHNLGQPSWWRGGGTVSWVQFDTAAERHDLRRTVSSRLGWNPQTAVVGVFNHAVSDALGTNHEAFTDLAEWFEETVEFAARHDEVNWLMVDHPSQVRYDKAGFFAGIAARHQNARHLQFRQSLDLTKNSLWSQVDLAVTVRGSVSNEFPAYGVPALQAGWSEWSGMGLSSVADTTGEYWQQLSRVITMLRAGRAPIDEEQIERARLWMWLYRSGTDVTTPLVPHWSITDADSICAGIEIAMRHVEIDADPLFAAIRRMWLRREPWLTRWDFSDDAHFEEHLAAPTTLRPAPRSPATAMSTIFDEPRSGCTLRSELRSGQDPALLIADQIARGSASIGRVVGDNPTIGVVLSDVGDSAVRANIRLALDDRTVPVWQDRSGAPGLPTRVRTVQVWCQGSHRGDVVLDPAAPPAFGLADGVTRADLGFRVEAADISHGGLLVIELRDADPDCGEHQTVGLRMVRLKLLRRTPN